MKKLCAYLTLFVLGIICFAQPAVATDYKFYFQKPSDWVAPVGFNSWAFEGGHYKTTAAGELGVTKMTLVAGTTDIYEIDIYDATSVGNIEFFSNGDTPDWNKTYKIENNASNIKSGWLYTTSGPQSEYTPPVVGPVDPVEPEDTFDVVFYLDCSKAGWTTPYLYTYEWSDEMNGKNTLCTTKLSNGIFKFVLKDQTTVGNILFRSTASEWGDDKQTDDIRPGTNGALYTLTSQSGRWQVSTTPNYVEPVVKPVVTATPASGTSFGYNESLTVSLASSVEATIYYTTNGDEPSETSTRYTGSFVLNSSATVKAFAVTYDGTKGDVATFEYTRTTPPTLYIVGQFTNDRNDWGNGTKEEMHFDADKGLYYWEASKAGDFMISKSSSDFWNQNFKLSGELPSSRPESSNVSDSKGGSLKLPAAGTIYFDYAGSKMWYEATTVDVKTEYTIWVDATATTWRTVRLYAFADWDFGPNSGGQGSGNILNFEGELRPNGLYKIVIKDVKQVGKFSFLHTIGSWNNENQSRDLQASELHDGALYVIGNVQNGSRTISINTEFVPPVELSDLYIVGSISDWGTFGPMTKGDDGIYSYSVFGASNFLLTDKNTEGWDADGVVYSPNTGAEYRIDGSKPAEANTYRTANGKEKSFRLLRAGTVYYDPATQIVWADYDRVTIQFAFDRTNNSWSQGVVAFVRYEDGDWILVEPASETAERTLFLYTVDYSKYPSEIYFANKANHDDNSLENVQPFERHKTYYYYNETKEYYVHANFIEGTGKDGWNTASVPMAFDPITGIYSFEAPKAGHFFITTWKSGDSGEWWHKDYCWVPRNATGHVTIPSHRPSSENVSHAQTTDKQDFLTAGKCTIYFVPNESTGRGLVWSSEPEIVGSRYVLHGQFVNDNFADVENRFNEAGADNVYTCVVKPGRASGEFGIRYVDADGNKIENIWFANADAVISEANPEITLVCKNDGEEGFNSKFNLSTEKSWLFTFSHNVDEPSKSTLKVEEYIEPEHEVTWDDFDYDVYIRGMLPFGTWDDGKGGATGTMRRTEVPGIWSYTIDVAHDDSYTNTNDEEERYHFMFSTKKLGMNGSSDFWGPNGENSYHPVTGIGNLSPDGTPIAFLPKSTEGQNFVFSRPCVFYVDMNRKLAWVVLLDEPSETDLRFFFWDKGGEVYPDIKWWDSNKASEKLAEIYVPNHPELGVQYMPFTTQNREMSVDETTRTSKWVGYRYYFDRSVDQRFTVGEGADAKLIDNLWVRIRKSSNNEICLERPYVEEATYTQATDGSVINEYGDIQLGEPLVKITPTIRRIHSNIVVTSDHPGGVAGEPIYYKYVNQFETGVSIDANNRLPFIMTGVTQKPSNLSDDEKDFVIGEPVPGAKVEFSKYNEATLSYGIVREMRSGTTGLATITGIDHVNAADEDNLTVKVTYRSEGMSFSLSKVEQLNSYRYATDEDGLPLLPTLNNSQSEDFSPKVTYFFGDPHIIAEDGTLTRDKHYAIDALIEHPFNFRDKMRLTRAAYVGYNVRWKNERESDIANIPFYNQNVALNGRPLIWDFAEVTTTKHSVENWHAEGFVYNTLAIQLHHVAHATTPDCKDAEPIDFDIDYYLIVPVATQVDFTAGVTPETRRARARIVGDSVDNPYTGDISGGTYEKFTRSFSYDPVRDNITTGVEDITVDDTDAPVELFTLQGIRVSGNNLAPGVYIRRQGRTASKVYIR